MSWLRVIDWFIPDSLAGQGTEVERRARLGVVLSALVIVLLLWGAAFRTVTGSPEIAAAAGLLAASFSALLLLMRATGSLLWVSQGGPFLLGAYALAVIGSTGGQAMGAILIAGLVPVTAVVLGGLRSGIVWTAITCGGLVAMVLAAGRGLELPAYAVPIVPPEARIRAAVLLTLGLFGVSVLYESIQRRAQRELEEARQRRLESEARFRTLTENASDVITEWDATGIIRYVNPQIESLTGMRPQELVDTHWLEHAGRVHRDDLERFSKALERVVQGYTDSDVAIRFQHDDGSWRWFEIIFRPFRTADGEGRIVSVGRDVTERREVETLRRLTHELEQTAAELARTNRELEEFTTVASHDLQEPLRKLVAFSDLLRDDLGGDLGEDAERDLYFIREGAERMRRLVQDLLALSRTGSAAMKPERIAAGVCVERALENLALRVEEAGAEVTIDDLPDVQADLTLVTEIFQNLIGNALKFAGAAPLRIRITAERRGGRWTLGVSDNGIGVPDDAQEEVFKPFRRLHAADAHQGSGIGLAICRKAVERHGGRIWLESQPGGGCHFRFTLEG